MRVLLVEDARAMRGIIRSMLEHLGFEVFEAEDGAQAWEALAAHRIDLLLTDWNMPVMNGLQLVEKVRERPELADMPIIMSTTRNQKEDVIAAVAAGVNNYISKPFAQPQLEARIAKAFSQTEAHLTRMLEPVLGDARRPALSDDSPFVLFAEGPVQETGRGCLRERERVRYLVQATQELQRLAAQVPELDLGYVLAESTHDVLKLIRFHRQHLKLLLVSTTLSGGGVTLARLARLSQDADSTVVLVLDEDGAVSQTQRASLERLGILSFTRRELDRPFLYRLFRDHAAAPARAASDSSVDVVDVGRRLERDMQLLVRLPGMPQVQHRIAELARDRNSVLEDWAAAVRTDPISSATLLRYARSPLYGFHAEVRDVKRAVTLMGKNMVRRVVYSATLKATLAEAETPDLPGQDLWRHSLAVAAAARILSFPTGSASRLDDDERQELASWRLGPEATQILRHLRLDERLPLRAGQDAYLGGLLHDIGKVALAVSYPGLTRLIIEDVQAHDWRVPMHAAEAQITGGADHAAAGRILLQTWDLGPDLVAAVGGHHEPADDAFARLVCLADFIGGAIQPFPRFGRYPQVLAIAPTQSGGDATPAPTAADLAAACGAFVPPSLLQDLGIDIKDLVDLALLLAPAVTRQTDSLRETGTRTASDASDSDES